MSYTFYKILHLLGIFATLVALAVTATHAALGGTRADNPMRKLLGAVHGIALLLVLTGGFGMLARLGVMHGALPTWVFLKLALWVAFAAAITLPYLSRAWARALLVAMPILAALGGATALLKPFT
jgi:hypothetical protein